MVCEQLKTCEYMRQLTKTDPFSARMIRTVDCWHVQFGRAEDCVHQVLDIGQVQDKIQPSYEIKGKIITKLLGK